MSQSPHKQLGYINKSDNNRASALERTAAALSTSGGLGAKLIYMGYFASLLHPPGRKTWLLFSVRDMSWGLRNPCFTKFSVVSFL